MIRSSRYFLGTPPNEKLYTLESADQAYRIFVENMAEGAATLTNEGTILYTNRRFAPHLWPALTDPTQIELIVLNLAINGRDAMKAGGTLTLETFNAVIESEPSPSRTPASVFRAMYSRESSNRFLLRRNPGKGSGLGLAQAFGFAKQSGGGVRIETRLGEGESRTLQKPYTESELTEKIIAALT